MPIWKRLHGLRWWIIAVVMLGTVVNYLTRNTLGFAAPLMLKDLRLAAEAAASVGANTPMGTRAAELYEAFVAGEGAGLDFSGIIKTLR